MQYQTVVTFEPLAQTWHAKMWLWKPNPIKCESYFNWHIPSHSPRRRLIPTSRRPGQAWTLNLEPISLVSIYWNPIMFAQNLCHSQIGYFSNSIDLNWKDRAKPPLRPVSPWSLRAGSGLVGVLAPTPRRAKPQIFNFQSSIFNSGLSGLGTCKS